MNSLLFPAGWRIAPATAVAKPPVTAGVSKVVAIETRPDRVRRPPVLFLDDGYANLCMPTPTWESTHPVERYLIKTLASRHWSMDAGWERFIIENERLDRLCELLRDAQGDADYAVFSAWCEFDPSPEQPFIGERGLDVVFGVRFPDAAPALQPPHLVSGGFSTPHKCGRCYYDESGAFRTDMCSSCRLKDERRRTEGGGSHG